MIAVALTPAFAWLATFAVHSSIAGAAALLVSLLLRHRAISLQESLLRLSLWAAVVSSSLQFVLPAWFGAPFALSLPPVDAVAVPPIEFVALDPADLPVVASPAASLMSDLPWRTILLVAAAAAALGGLFWLVTVHRRLSRVLATRLPETDARVLTTAAAVAACLGLRQSPHISRSPLIATPIAFGWLRPEVCLPVRATSLGDESLRAMLAHEVAHLRRGDPAWMWLAAWLNALFPWQPMLHLVRRRWARLVELRCDAVAASHSSPAAVARCLIDVAEWLRPMPASLALGMAARPSALRERVEAVLRAGTPRAPNRAVAAVLSGLSLSALTVAAPGVAAEAPATEPTITMRESVADPAEPPTASTPPTAPRGAAPLQAVLELLRAEQAELQHEADALAKDLDRRAVGPDIRQMQAALRQRLSDLDRSRQRLEALLERRAPRSR